MQGDADATILECKKVQAQHIQCRVPTGLMIYKQTPPSPTRDKAPEINLHSV